VFDRFSASHFDLHFHSRPEPVDDRHEAIDGEPPEVRVADAREVGRRNPGAALCAADAQALPVERLDDFRGQDGLELIGIGILVSEVAKNISASPHYFQLFAFHRNISFKSLQTVLDQIDFTFGRLDALRRFLLKRMDNPDVLAKLHGINNPERIPLNGRAISITPDSIPCIGFAMSALPPSAAIVKAARQIDLAPSGNESNSLSAALIQETGRVLLVICRRYSSFR